MVETKKKVAGYANIRVLATFLVVIGHATSLGFGTGEKLQNPYAGGLCEIKVQSMLEELRVIIYDFHMPLFVILSGALFMLTYKPQNMGHKWILKRSKRLIVPYFTVAILLFIPIRFLIGYNNWSETLRSLVVDVVLGKDINYLWYVVMLFEVDVIMCFLHKYVTSKNCILSIALLLTFAAISFSRRYIGELPFQLHRTMEFLLWFYIGIKFEQFREKINTVHYKGIGTIAFLLFAIAVYGKVVILSNTYVLGFTGSVAAVAFCFCTPEIRSGFFKLVEQRSFRIYLYHVPLMYAYSKVIHVLIQPQQMNDMLYLVLAIGKACVGLLGALLLDKLIQMILQNGRKLNNAF